ncbi:MAG: DNA starvation/stationary phase protection protein Dps [Myxococcota bacterium]
MLPVFAIVALDLPIVGLTVEATGDTMYSTKNDIAADVREKVIILLNARLADAVDLMMQAKQAHWNVKGPNFHGLHELFDELNGEMREYVDTIAERAVILGGEARGSTRHAVEASKLPAYPEGVSDWKGHVDALSTSVAAFAKNIRAAIKLTEELGDAGTADLFTEVSRGVDKRLWMIEAHLG